MRQTAQSEPACFDVAIVGGGMVGASLAMALNTLPIRVALIEAVGAAQDFQPSFDSRTLALSNATQQVFNTLGLWSEWASEAVAVRRIHVSEKGQFGSALVDAAELGLAQLGFILPAQALGRVLLPALERAAITLFNPATVMDYTIATDAATLQLDTPQGAKTVRARLVVAADGAQSRLRTQAKLAAPAQPYHQSAIIAPVKVSAACLDTAYERFTESGPIAILPRPGGVVVIWAVASAYADALQALSATQYLATLQQAFGWRLGQFTELGARTRYELALTVAEHTQAERLVLIGNAAQSLHPIAGQGFNLGLRDAMTLADLLADALTQNASVDVGRAAVLAPLAKQRASDRQRVIRFTDGLVRAFGLNLPALRCARARALGLFDLSLFAKHALSAIASGGASYQPRLARGLKLTP